MKKTSYKKMKDLQDKHWWFVARREIIGSIIQDYKSKKRSNLLEVGSGTGGNFETLNKFGNVTGLEPSKFALSLAQVKQQTTIFNSSIEDMPTDDFKEKYDFIFLLDVLEHIKQPELALKKIKKIASENTLIILTVPAYQYLWGPHDEEHKHYRRYTRKMLTRSLESQGFTIQKASYMNTLLFPAVFVTRLINKFFNKSVINDNKMPSPFINLILKKTFRLEKYILKHTNLPFGCSLLIVCSISKKNQNK